MTMHQLSVILVLVLAATNASKYLRPLHEFQQEVIAREIPDYLPISVSEGLSDENFGELPMSKETSLEDYPAYGTRHPTLLLAQLLANRHTNQEEMRKKRADASLSIVNALDVLRQQIMLEFARRKINESKAQIQKNREFLSKAGKRSSIEDELRLQDILLNRREHSTAELPAKSAEDTRRTGDDESAFRT